MNSIERGTIDVFWHNYAGEVLTWTRFACHQPEENAVRDFLRCVLCPDFMNTMKESGFMDDGRIICVFRKMTPEDILSYEPPTT